MMRTIDDIPNISGKKVLLRLTLNIPIKDGQIADDFRLIKSLPTLRSLIERGARVTLISHLGSGGDSLVPVEKYLREKIGGPPAGGFVVRENLRRDPRELAGDESFAHELSEGQDVFVNEDFAVSHRAHASVVGLPKFLPSYIGYQFAAEVENLSRFIDSPQPCVVILGGAKLETKLPMIEAFLSKARKIFLGSYFAKHEARISKHEKIIMPIDVINKDGQVVDIGPKTLASMQEAVANAASVIWNGPLGKFEEGFDQTTLELARAIANSSAKSVVGGGDSIAAIRKLNLLDKFTFVSTGGGAMLEFLAKGTLPGIEAIINSNLEPRT